MLNIIRHIVIIYYCVFIFSNLSFADINYYLTHTDNKIHVRGEFGKYNKQDKIELFVPGKIFGTDYSKQIKNIIIPNGNYNPANVTANLNQDGNLIIEYDIVSLQSKQFIDGFTNRNYHYIDKTKFFILGEGFFIYPKTESIFESVEVVTPERGTTTMSTRRETSDDVVNLKSYDYSDQKVIIQFNSSAKKIASNIKPYFYKDPIITKLDDLTPLIILGNEDFYTSEPIQNTKLIVWSTDKDLGNRINSIAGKALQRHKNFWQDINFDQVAIFIPNPFVTNMNQWSGRVMDNMLVAFINPSSNQDEEIYNLVNHEDLHFWFGCGLIKGPAWFTEGFSDYYMDKINYYFSSDKAQFVDNYNDKLKKYFLSPFFSLSNKYFDEHQFIYKATEKLPYLKGYLIAGQIDSIIDLDKALRTIIKTCRVDKQNCHFSKELLFKYAEDITADKQEKITKLIDNFNRDDLATSFLNTVSLERRETLGFVYDIDIMHIIKDKVISGKYLNKLDPKYTKSKFYNISELIIGDSNTLHFFLDNNGKIEEFFPKTTSVPVEIPYYK